jgi:hypothetical protein
MCVCYNVSVSFTYPLYPFISTIDYHHQQDNEHTSLHSFFFSDLPSGGAKDSSHLWLAGGFKPLENIWVMTILASTMENEQLLKQSENQHSNQQKPSTSSRVPFDCIHRFYRRWFYQQLTFIETVFRCLRISSAPVSFSGCNADPWGCWLNFKFRWVRRLMVALVTGSIVGWMLANNNMKKHPISKLKSSWCWYFGKDGENKGKETVIASDVCVYINIHIYMYIYNVVYRLV